MIIIASNHLLNKNKNVSEYGHYSGREGRRGVERVTTTRSKKKLYSGHTPKPNDRRKLTIFRRFCITECATEITHGRINQDENNKKKMGGISNMKYPFIVYKYEGKD